MSNSVDVLILSTAPENFEVMESSLYDSTLVIAVSRIISHAALSARVIIFDLDSLDVSDLFGLAREFDGSIIATYSAGNKPNILNILQRGIDDCLCLDESRVIAARVKRLLDRSTPSTPALLEKNGWKVNKQTLHVERPDGQRVPLTTSQAALFVFLFEYEGTCISREFISSELYGDDWTYGNRKIDVSISSLRKKLKQAQAPAKVHTISGQGYLLSVFQSL